MFLCTRRLPRLRSRRCARYASQRLSDALEENVVKRFETTLVGRTLTGDRCIVREGVNRPERHVAIANRNARGIPGSHLLEGRGRSRAERALKVGELHNLYCRPSRAKEVATRWEITPARNHPRLYRSGLNS